MKIVQQSILDHTEGIIAHGVNCCGVMGKGVALSIREAYPMVAKQYFAKFTRENKIHPEFLGFYLIEVDKYCTETDIISVSLASRASL